MGKAIANGFPLAAVGGRADVMEAVSRTWISSTLATEFVSLAAARATLAMMVERAGAGAHLQAWEPGCSTGSADAGGADTGASCARAAGLPEMCFLEYRDEPLSRPRRRGLRGAGAAVQAERLQLRVAGARRGDVDRTLDILDDALTAIGRDRHPERPDCLVPRSASDE